ncbi:head completion/stabilization protein [Kiloniella sp. b19]|uniref:head completion/stabilization protein n=1 Tax=Kiloniella sp. GXU_MW_B19 TaxID=3141326 RepID=UPI0031D6770D
MNSTFVANSPAQNEDTTIRNDGWWPDLDLSDFKADYRIATDNDDDRLSQVVIAAILEINSVAADWKKRQEATDLSSVPAPQIDGESEKVILYRNAVFYRAKSLLVAGRRDHDTTNSGHDRANRLDDSNDEWMRMSTDSVNNLTDRKRFDAELL